MIIVQINSAFLYIFLSQFLYTKNLVKGNLDQIRFKISGFVFANRQGNFLSQTVQR